jgi:hypothetical protein
MRNSVLVEHRLRQRDRHQHQLVGVHAQPLPGRRQHADDAQAPVADADHAARAPARRRRARSRILSPITATAEAAAASPRAAGSALADPSRAASEVGAGADHHDLAQRPPTLISELPTASGATRCTSAARSSAAASSMVRSRGVLVTRCRD